MDEKKGKDVCVGRISESTTLVVSEHVAGEAQVEGPHSEGVERVKDGVACNGDDIMVEVLGSNVYFDGVCTHGEARRSVAVENEIGAVGDGNSLEEDVKSLGGGPALGEAGLQGLGGSSVDASKHGTETGVEGSLGIVESRGEQTQAVVVEECEVIVREEENIEGGAVKGETGREVVASGSGTGDRTEQDATVLDIEAQKTEVGTEDGDSLVVLDSTHGGAQFVHVEEVVMVAREAVLEKEMVEVGADIGGQVMDCVVDAIEDRESKEVGALDEKASVTRNENGEGDSSVVVGSVGVESLVVNEDAIFENVEHLEIGLVVEGDQPGGGLADGGLNVAYNLMPQKASVVDDDVWNPGISSVVVCATSSAENSSLQTDAFPEKASVIFNQQRKVLTSGSSALDGVVSSSERKLMEDASSGGTKNGDGDPKSLDEKKKVAAKGDTLCSNVEGMKIDVIDENATCSMEEQQGNIEQVGESSENQRDVSPTPVSSCLPNQAAVGDVDTVIDDKGYSLLNSTVVQEMEVDKQVIEEQLVDVETFCLSTASHGHKCANSTPDLVVTVGGAAAKYDKVLSDSNVEVTETVCRDGMLSCSVNDQNLKEERMCGITQTEVHITNRMESSLMECEAVLDSISEVSVPTKKDKPLESEEYLEKDVGGDLPQIECEDAMLSNQPIQVVVKGEVATVDGSDLLNSNVETDTQVIGREGIAPMDAEEILNSNVDVPGTEEFEECLRRSMAGDSAQIDSRSELQVGVEKQETKAEQVGFQEEQGMELEEDIADTEQSKADEEKFLERANLNAGSMVEVHQASYQLPSENEGEFTVSDLVWGKVRSHPWWPGQIFDPADSSEKAIKHHRKDCFLVAYFGDRTFAWNEASQLKAFRTHFSHIEKQSNSEAFQNAVDCALEEVSRRVEFGLACSCIPKDAFDRIKFQEVENTGIRQESITRDRVDRSASASSFEPDKLIKYVQALARYPSGDSDRLEVVIAKAQLLAFCRLKGYSSLPEFQFCGQLLESDMDTLVSEDRMHSIKVFEHVDDELTSFEQEISKNQNSFSNKHKQDFKDDVFYKKKERSLSELMGDTMDSPDGDDWLDGKTTSSGKKRKAVDYHDDHGPQDGRKTISFAKVSSTIPPSSPKPSFKIGDCIRRAASQLTGSPSILKWNGERLQKIDGSHDVPAGNEADASFLESDTQRGRVGIPTEYSSLDDLLLQLQIAAQDPLKAYDLSDTIVSFFSDFRNSVIVGQHSRRDLLAMDKVHAGKRKKSSHFVVGSPETYEFEDMSDTYWTDRVVQNGSEDKTSRRNKKREYQVVPVVLDTPQVGRRPYSRKRYSDGNDAVAAEKPAGYVDENSPAEIVMNFAEVNSVPSETNLNKMFRRFGPLKESETEVDRDTSRARVVYKHSSDAEVAFSSARRFNIFGPTLVNYQINYTPSALFKASPMDTAQDHEMQFDLAALEVNLV
ncbi:hypothetical protein I3842_02G174000 [Carya illinoinensis]|uniref:PWWP domain-containing protein n=2 Tax=Carya illinoinensis TaxID=32201 RepID=A0A922FTZ7_CARIL|nr:hypothetical protein I3842_02G174000 [Carya illinoinensis]KAG6728461.1 hypothetical protein I3842_02G174000 [Carya illinoinensis]